MKKRCREINVEFEKIINTRTNESLEKIENEILEECKTKNEDSNKSFFVEKIKQYKLFKNSKTNSKNKEWKTILNLRTHSKKIKKRGRKTKKIKSTENIIKDNTKLSVNSLNLENENKVKYKLFI